jgi:N-methylhydantoinase A
MADRLEIVGIDVGGTFTDVAALDPSDGRLRIAKVPTVPSRPELGLIEGLQALSADADASPVEIRHGTTIVTNALLERRFAPTGLLCTRGFRDVLETRRLWREHLFGYDWERPASIIPRRLRLEVTERIGPSGEVLCALNEDDVRAAARILGAARVESVAVAYLFSFRNSAHERRTREILADELPGVPVTLSAEILPEVHEYERTSTAALNALLRPTIERYLRTVATSLTGAGMDAPLRIVRSDGALMRPEVAASEPVRLVKSGPAAGVIGSARLGARLGWPNIVTLDMGGTSTDVALVWNGEPLRVLETDVAWNIPIRAMQMDVRSIGAGGGSIIGCDEGGILAVGPRSAGADPGPVAYGRGGTEATLTDALLLLGVLPDALLGGRLELDRTAAAQAVLAALPAFGSSIEAAAAAQELTLQKMAVLIREVTVARGYDPRDCVLFCFGGAGALFALDLAGELEMTTVYVPPAATVFSAVGATLSRVAYEAKTGMYARIETLDPATLAAEARAVADRALALLAADALPLAELRLEVDLKYRVQPETLTVPFGVGGGVFAPADLQALDDDTIAASVARFHALHRQLYGLDRGREAVDLVTFRAIAAGPGSDGWALRGTDDETGEPAPPRTRTWVRRGVSLADVPAISIGRLRAGPLSGPCFLEDPYTTIPVPPGATARIDDLGGIVLRWNEDGPR